MPKKESDRNISLELGYAGSVKLASAESVVLRTLDVAKRANAYVIWQKSGLKHYPTVLRALKNLQSKEWLDVIESGEGRGNRLFALSTKGEILMLSQQEDSIIMSVLSDRSARFRSLAQSEVEDARRLASRIMSQTIMTILRKTGKRINIDDIVEISVLDYVGEWLTEAENYLLGPEEDERQVLTIVNEMKCLSTISWVRDLILKQAKHFSENANKTEKMYKDLIADLKI